MWDRPLVLEGQHVRLEPLTREHHPGLTEVGLDPDLWVLTVSRVSDTAGMMTFIEQALAAQAAGTALPFATIERAGGRVAGCTRFMNMDRANRRVEIGATWVARPWQRTAVNTEAKYLMMRHAFESMGCIRVELKTDALNERSRAAIKRIGAKEEGILRRHMITDTGRLRDSVYYSVIDSEWPAVKAMLEAKLGS